MTIRFTIFLIALSFACATKASKKQLDIVLAENINWGYLNPLRGDKSPGAANLWGDRTTDTATGMLVRFKQGFSSPPHIHNISYRGIVIDGLLHNAHPDNDKNWMTTGSYWTQPAGHNHITAANGATNLIYLEIDNGPYLVQPSKSQFNNGEHPINVHESNMVWLQQAESALINSKNAALTHLWQSHDAEPKAVPTHGVLVKLSPDFSGKLASGSQGLRAVVISGALVISETVAHSAQHENAQHTLLPGSYFRSSGKSKISLKTNTETLLYIRFQEPIRIDE